MGRIRRGGGIIRRLTHSCGTLPITTIIIASIVLLQSTRASDEVGTSKHQQQGEPIGITHCELKPVACSVICGTASPICELGGNCDCRKPRDQKSTHCYEPEGEEAKRCHPKLCQRRGPKGESIAFPMVCHVTKKLKLCTCFPMWELE